MTSSIQPNIKWDELIPDIRDNPVLSLIDAQPNAPLENERMPKACQRMVHKTIPNNVPCELASQFFVHAGAACSSSTHILCRISRLCAPYAVASALSRARAFMLMHPFGMGPTHSLFSQHVERHC
jgi:hypothetical protein